MGEERTEGAQSVGVVTSSMNAHQRESTTESGTRQSAGQDDVTCSQPSQCQHSGPVKWNHHGYRNENNAYTHHGRADGPDCHEEVGLLLHRGDRKE